MNVLPNSRKLNGVSLVEYLQEDNNSLVATAANTEDQYDYPIDLTQKEQEAIVRKRYHNNNVKKHAVSKTSPPLRSTASLDNENNNQSLSAPGSTPPCSSTNNVKEKRILSSHSKQSSSHIRIIRSKKQQQQHKKMISKSTTTTMTKNYHLPMIQSASAHNGTFRRCHRHTLDFSTMDSGVLDHQILRRANSLCNSSIYSTFASPSQINTTFSSSSSSSASSSSSSSAASLSVSNSSSSCMADPHKDTISIQYVSQPKQHHSTEKQSTQQQQQHQEGAMKHRSNQQEMEPEESLQKRLWNEDVTLCPKEEIAEFLGSPKSSRPKVLMLYMNNFDFANQRLDAAFRTLCAKLYLKAESQQLDRIIEAFAKRYYECNPTTLFHCFDVVYAVAYSLLLLNTDLHVVNDWTNKMTRSSFIKNTMETIQSLVFPHLTDTTTFSQQRKRCASLVSHQSMDSASYHLERNDSSPSTISYLNDEDTPHYHSDCSSQSISGGSSPITTTSNLSQKFDAFKSNISRKSITCSSDGLTRTQKTWLADVEGLLKEMYAAVKSHRIDQAEIMVPAVPAIPPQTTALHRSRTLPKNTMDQLDGSLRRGRRRRGQSVIIDRNSTPMDDLLNIYKELPLLPNVRKQDMFKQGLVMRKHVMERTDKRARHRQWQLCYLVITDTELIMYKPTQQQPMDDTDKGRRRKSTSMMLWNPSTSFSSLQDIVHQHPHWQADEEQAPLATLEMNHTYATAIPPPGWNSQRPHVFRLETGDGGLWLFESVDLFAVQAWVEACNMTAAKISKGPLPGAICNIDYGWGAKWDNTTQEFAGVPVWYPPTPCMVNSTLSINQQYLDIEVQITQLNKQLNEHRELKLSVDKKFGAGHQACVNSMQALTNWDKKLHFILHELIKLRCYKDMLLQLQIMF
ncbi:conserved hypothetical protein [Mucor ambiguus]|uniref:SEC7 domain-containing protein n=1 Tax=Mucor ambiguus TaxID=91626 RepID=A0A0C9MAR7_9FUNG|nr:conserved hypothetical protein [Mucor ambiguus]